MTDASIVAKPAYDQVLTLSLERCLVDGMAPPLVVCLVGVTGAAHVVRYRPPDLLGEHVGGELVARAMEPEGDTVAAAIYVKVSLLS